MIKKSGDIEEGVQEGSAKLGSSHGDSETRSILCLAIEHQNAGRFREAQQLYSIALKREPQNADILHALAIVLTRSGEHEDAASLAEQAIGIRPENAGLRCDLGAIYMALDRPEDAVASLRRATRLDPRIAIAHNNLGIAYREQGKLEEALACFHKALAIDPNFAEAFNNLGNALKDLGRLEDAERAYRSGLSINPNYVTALSNLGEALRAQGRLEEAIASCRHALALAPNLADALINLGNALRQNGNLDEAIAAYQSVLRGEPDNGAALANLGNAFRAQGKSNEAVRCYRRVLEIQPTSESTAHLLAALTGETPESTPESYIRSVFDQYARMFDAHLTGQLEYATPGLLRQEVEKVVGNDAHFEKVIDLGCGTGLAGGEFRGMAVLLEGIDLSPEMIAKAREKNVYDRLEIGEVAQYLRSSTRRYDLFVAADVLVYVGNLNPIFDAVRRRANTGAYFVFSVESCQDTDYVLRVTGRYAHSAKYIESLARKFDFGVAGTRNASLRKQAGEDVVGTLFTLEYGRA